MNAMRYLGRISENPRADDAAHDNHRGIEQPKLTTRLNRCCHSEPIRLTSLAQGKLREVACRAVVSQLRDEGWRNL